MKCPKCGYLGFEQAERCRNCGYEFALTAHRPDPELSLRDEPDLRSFDDLDLVDSAAASPTPRSTPARSTSPDPLDEVDELPLFTEEAALITKPSPPRAPLSVRRATPDTPRVKKADPLRPSSSPAQESEPESEAELEVPLDAPVSPAARAHDLGWAPAAASAAVPAGLGVRATAAAIDLGLLALIDLAVVYLTMQICGLTSRELDLLPLAPLVAFLLVQNGGYLLAFTVGGQTIGKMVTGIKVEASEPGHAIDLGRAASRVLVWVVMVLPLGLGLLSALLSADRRGFHDRVAGTRVVRATAS